MVKPTNVRVKSKPKPGYLTASEMHAKLAATIDGKASKQRDRLAARAERKARIAA